MIKYVDICKLSIDFYLYRQFILHICSETTFILDSDSIANHFITAQYFTLDKVLSLVRLLISGVLNRLTSIFYQTLYSFKCLNMNMISIFGPKVGKVGYF